MNARTHTGFRAHGRKGITGPEQEALAACALFVVYNVECERFDETVCTGQPAPDGSGVMPRTLTETGIIVAHAERVLGAMMDRAESLGVDRRVLPAAEAFVMRMPYARVQADYRTALKIIGGGLS